MFKKNRMYLVIILILLATNVGGYFYFNHKIEEKTDVVALVNGQGITNQELILQLKDIYGKEVLNDIISRRVIKLAAEKYNIKVKQSEIDKEYDQYKRDYNSEEDFQAYLKEQMGWTKEKLLDYIEYYLLWEDLAIKDVKITEGEIKDYYNENKELYNQPEQFHIQQIIVQTKEEANQIVNEIKNGSNFGTLAKERSLDALSLASGGDLGYVSFEDPDIDPTILEKAKGMNEDETKIVALTEGYAIIKLLGYKDAINPSYDEIKDEIRREIALRKVPSLPEILDQLKTEMNVQILDKSL